MKDGIERMISVVVPCHNSEHTIARCLDSLLDQTYNNLEVLCIDDGSKDGTMGIIQDFAKKRQAGDSCN